MFTAPYLIVRYAEKILTAVDQTSDLAPAAERPESLYGGATVTTVTVDHTRVVIRRHLTLIGPKLRLLPSARPAMLSGCLGEPKCF
jgi:hypothetical protein